MSNLKYLDFNGAQDIIDETKTRLNSKQNIFQVSTMPTASASLVGTIYQYIGVTTSSYINGYFYKCVEGTTAGTYKWERVNVQLSGSGSSVQSDWNQSDTTADDYIKNKPTLGTASALDVATSGNASSSQVVKGDDTRLTDARTPTAHSHDAATTSAAGFMSSTDKTKLDGISTGATANSVLEFAAIIDTDMWSTIVDGVTGETHHSKTVSVPEILATDSPFIDISPSSTPLTGTDQIEQFGYISKATTNNGSITFYCYEEKPDINLPINIKVVR